MAKCRNCSRPLRAASGAGRQRDFCLVACRRAAEAEIKRVNVRLGSLEDRLSESRLPGAFGLAIDAVDPKLLEKEIALQRARLLELLCEETAPEPK